MIHISLSWPSKIVHWYIFCALGRVLKATSVGVLQCFLEYGAAAKDYTLVADREPFTAERYQGG